MNNIEILNFIINIILATSAISASIFAGLTLRQAYKFKKEEKESRAAFIAPSEQPGYLRFPDLLDNEPSLAIRLKNYGRNPAEKIYIKIVSFNKLDIDGTNKIVKPVFLLEFDGQNPIPYSQELIINATTQKLNYKNISDFEIMATDFIAIKVSYYDRILAKKFEEKFYWHVEDEGKLFEVTNEYIDSLKEFSNKYLTT